MKDLRVFCGRHGFIEINFGKVTFFNSLLFGYFLIFVCYKQKKNNLKMFILSFRKFLTFLTRINSIVIAILVFFLPVIKVKFETLFSVVLANSIDLSYFNLLLYFSMLYSSILMTSCLYCMLISKVKMIVSYN